MPPLPWQELLRKPTEERHMVQLYRDPAFLRDAVASWTAPALQNGGGAVLIGTSTSVTAVLELLRRQGFDTDALTRSGRLATFDAEGTLEQFMRNGVPDPALTKKVVGDALRRARAACGPNGDVRAWGEMVNVLWRAGERHAANRLEAIWNDIIDEHGVSLLCSYAVDNLSPDTHAGALRDICATHDHLIPEEDERTFSLALEKAIKDVCDEEATALRERLRDQARSIRMPSAEAMLVALHDEDPGLARRVLDATKSHLNQAS